MEKSNFPEIRLRRATLANLRFPFSIILLLLLLFCQGGPATGRSISILTRYSYYTTEDSASVIVNQQDRKIPEKVQLRLYFGERMIADTSIVLPAEVPFSLNGISAGNSKIRCSLDGGQMFFLDTVIDLKILPPKANEVKIDRMTGTLRVGGLPLVPFGFYNYWPVRKTLPEEEVVRGFNMISPYQRIEKKSFRARKRYMDRCAELGIKVHYNLLSVSGGGGVGSGRLEGLTAEEKKKRLIREVLAMKDHPALLSWYIADEPVGQGVPPESLLETYRLVKKLDPYHPVSMVFMAPQQAWKYRDALDIVMADPYPVPNSSVAGVGRVIRNLTRTFYPEKPVWLVPQAFGGNEWWAREPTPGEVRVMTYLGIINGATGIQYFVRHGYNGFPKSLVTWSECGAIAMETAELTPFYARGRGKPLEASAGISAAAWQRGDTVLVVCVNSAMNPVRFSVTLPADVTASRAAVLSENRDVTIHQGMLEDDLDAINVKLYIMVPENQDTPADTLNMVMNGGFEHTVMPGVPQSTYQRVGKDRGATAFVDSRISHHGTHALRLNCPRTGKGMGISFYPVELELGGIYSFSFWARAAASDSLWSRRSFFYRLFHRKPGPPKARLRIGEYADTTVFLTPSWEKYTVIFTHTDTASVVARTAPYLELISRGQAWFDDLSCIPLISLKTRVETPGKFLRVSVKNLGQKGNLKVFTDDKSRLYQEQAGIVDFILDHSADVTIEYWEDHRKYGTTSRNFTVHQGLGAKIVLENPSSSRYRGGGPNPLLDGRTALPDYRDGHWVGFPGKDLRAIVDLDSVQPVQDISSRFLHQPRVWIFLPAEVRFALSEDGLNFTEVYFHTFDSLPPANGAFATTARWHGPDTARYVKIEAVNRGVCPSGYPGAGEKAWLFVDEIVIK